jgi:hypothetical protein
MCYLPLWGWDHQTSYAAQGGGKDSACFNFDLRSDISIV